MLRRLGLTALRAEPLRRSSLLSGVGLAQEEPFDAEAAQYFRESVLRWLDSDIHPNLSEWEAAGRVPKDVYKAAGNLGVLGVGFPQALGGTTTDIRVMVAMNDALAETGSGGFLAAMSAHCISLPPIVNLAPAEMRDRVVPEVLSGEKTAALGVTEHAGGSDVAQLKTTARLEGDHYIVNGSKTYITGGLYADYYTIAVRTGDETMRGALGLSLLLIERGTPGFTQRCA